MAMWDWKSPKRTGRVFEMKDDRSVVPLMTWAQMQKLADEVPMMTRDERLAAKVRQHNEAEVTKRGKNARLIGSPIRKSKDPAYLKVKAHGYETKMPAEVTPWEKAAAEERVAVKKTHAELHEEIKAQNILLEYQKQLMDKIRETQKQAEAEKLKIAYEESIRRQMERLYTPVQTFPLYPNGIGGLMTGNPACYPQYQYQTPQQVYTGTGLYSTTQTAVCATNNYVATEYLMQNSSAPTQFDGVIGVAKETGY